MSKRQRVALVEQAPSTVSVAKHGKRSSEKLLLEADGINAMTNPDGSITIEAYNSRESILLRLMPDDVKAQSHVWKQWKDIR